MLYRRGRRRVTTSRTLQGFRALVLLALGAAGCAAATANADSEARSLREDLGALITEPPFDRVHWGILAVDALSGQRIYSTNPDLLFIPASNMKLPVTISALGLLGPEYRWQTTFYSRVLPVDGRLEGDLYLPAAGDPTLGEPFHSSGDSALAAIAASLRAAGIREVRGRLVVDASAWDSTTVAESWMVEDLPVRAGATGGAFVVNRGELEIRVRGAGRAGEPAEVTWAPRGRDREPGAEDFPFVESRVVTSPAGTDAELRAGFLPESRRWTVEGRIGVEETRTLLRSARDPVRLAVRALERALASEEIPVEGGSEILWERGLPLGRNCRSGAIPSCAEMLRVSGMASPPLRKVVAAILGPSQNWMTEQLVRTLGQEEGTEGSWPEGFQAIMRQLEAAAGIDPEDVNWEDGSGLSNHNLISPRALVAVLRYARREPWGEIFRSSLAQPGLAGTSLASRLEGLEGRVFAKTGSLSHVNSLSGYLVTPDGREVIFAILTNGANLPAREVRARIDAVVRELTAHSIR